MTFRRYYSSVITIMLLQVTYACQLGIKHFTPIRYLTRLSVNVNMTLEFSTLCKVGIAYVAFKRIVIKFECQCESAGYHYVKTGHDTYHTYKVFVQCECEYASSGEHFVQTGHRTYHIYKVSHKCENVYKIMLHQTTTECKLSTSSVTFMRFLSRVSEHRPLQDSTLCKQGATNVTSIRFLSSVIANVIVQMVISCKLGATHITCIWFPRSVSKNMILQGTTGTLC